MEERKFRELFRKMVDRYELTADKASELLSRILAVLKADSEHACMTKYGEREETR